MTHAKHLHDSPVFANGICKFCGAPAPAPAAEPARTVFGDRFEDYHDIDCPTCGQGHSDVAAYKLRMKLAGFASAAAPSAGAEERWTEYTPGGHPVSVVGGPAPSAGAGPECKHDAPDDDQYLVGGPNLVLGLNHIKCGRSVQTLLDERPLFNQAVEALSWIHEAATALARLRTESEQLREELASQRKAVDGMVELAEDYAAQRDAAVADAARYRWLRARWDADTDDDIERHSNAMNAWHPDAAIDAALDAAREGSADKGSVE